MPGSATPQPALLPLEAITVAEAISGRFQRLNISGSDIEEVPKEVARLMFVTSLDCSNNPIKSFQLSSLPKSLTELRLTGCELQSLPSNLGKLEELKQLFLGANSLDNADAVFHCQCLQHAGLAYNKIKSIPVSLLPSCNILSLDLSHNDLTDLEAVSLHLPLLSMLRSLSLSGNPFCLLPQYEQTIRTVCKDLKYFDGVGLLHSLPGATLLQTNLKLDMYMQKFETYSLSNPSTAPPSSAPDDTSNTDRSDTYLQLEFSGLQILVDPFAAERERYQNPVTSESPVAPDPTATPELPLQPVFYHVDFVSQDGMTLSSIPIKISPPQPPVQENPKEVKKPPAAAGKDKSEASPPKPLQRGSFRVCLSVSASCDWRNWIRRGIELKLVCTTLKSVLKPSTEQQQQANPPVTPPPAAKGKGKKGEAEPPPLPEFDVTSSQEIVGTTSILCGVLVNGHTYNYESTLAFSPIKALWDQQGLRMGLEDERHATHTLAKARVKMLLHAPPERQEESAAAAS